MVVLIITIIGGIVGYFLATGKNKTVILNQQPITTSPTILPTTPIPTSPSTPDSTQSLVGDIIFPADSGIINVKNYGAKGDGKTDDTAAILKAIQENIAGGITTIIYLPSGTYLVSDRLEWRDKNGKWQAFLTFQGQNRQNTIIKLKDNAPGYNDTNNPKAVIFTAAAGFGKNPTAGGKDWTNLGEGNTAFQNYILDITVDTGSGNPGAIGIDYLTSNMGSVRDVTIKSGDGRGKFGLALNRKWPGPGLIKNVRIEGFDYGISIAQTQYGMTFEHITLNNQKVAGIQNIDNVLSMRDLKSTNSVPVIQNAGGKGLVTLIDGSFTGGSLSVSAIENDAGELFARNITVTGYKSAIKNKGSVISGQSISEFVSNKPYSLFPSPQKSLNLPVQETPEVLRDPVNQWVSVIKFGAKADIQTFDNTPAFQAAIDSGASTIYVPKGKYLFSDTVKIHGNVKRIDFMGSKVGTTKTNNFGSAKPLFRVEDGTQPVVMIERLGGVWKIGPIPATGVEHASSKTLVIRNGGGDSKTLPGSGSLFLEDVGLFHLETKSQNVWVRQLNPEGKDLVGSSVLNDGGNLWILGIKTEGAHTVIKTIGGGKTELLGGLLYPVRTVPSDLPAFINEESSHSLVYVVKADGADKNYQIQVRETRNTVTKTLQKTTVISRGAGSIVPLYVGYSNTR